MKYCCSILAACGRCIPEQGPDARGPSGAPRAGAAPVMAGQRRRSRGRILLLAVLVVVWIAVVVAVWRRAPMTDPDQPASPSHRPAAAASGPASGVPPAGAAASGPPKPEAAEPAR